MLIDDLLTETVNSEHERNGKMESSVMILIILIGTILNGLIAIWRELRTINGPARIRPIQHDPRRDVAHIKQETPLSVDDPLIDVLHGVLGNRTGKLRVSDAYLICGIEAGKVNQDQIERFGRAIRELGWEYLCCYFNGSLQHVYVRGTAAERAVPLAVEYDPHMRTVRIEAVKSAPAAN